MILVPCLLLSLLYMTQGGMYMLTLVDWYAFFPSVAVFGMLECVVVSWIYESVICFKTAESHQINVREDCPKGHDLQPEVHQPRIPSAEMEHEKWGSHVDYMMTLLGYSIGVGSMWKFPYMCMRNGGGMGIGGVLISIFYSTYYSALFAWLIYYFYHSFFPNIPWSTCDNIWNTPSCISYTNVVDDAAANATNDSIANAAMFIHNSSAVANRTIDLTGMTAAEEFWKLKVLQISDGLEDLGSIRWPLVGCLFITYILAFVCLFQGIKVSGKVVYVTVGVPYILIAVFLIRGCLLPGSADGIYFFIYPHFERLLDPKIWIEACNFALLTVGIAFGCLPTMAGHNKFNNNCFRDAVTLVAAVALTSVYIGFAFFAIMGHVAYQRGVTVEAFQSSGIDHF
ncbi:sodium- and chloride-dependent glycine transporter 1-like [Haliotis rubra]|uniref:sodium- and chloride-dependent glycine transporter 1-like n=1 Tax=Haliotis rubra TaxID=36100 RepID=UPI001EE5D9B0|nr:sodium- and chloride-dependent glycine transporter 1-like [Haliotis rubra]